MFKWLFSFCDKTNRSSDMTMLWPSCKMYARDIHQAKAAFFMHVINDPAWTDYYSHDELVKYVDDLQ